VKTCHDWGGVIRGVFQFAAPALVPQVVVQRLVHEAHGVVRLLRHTELTPPGGFALP